MRPREPHVGAPVVAAVTLHGDLDFTLEERKEIERAAEVIAFATAGAVRVRIVWDLDWRTIQGNETNLLLRADSSAEFIGRIDPSGTMLGVTSPGTRSVILVADRIAAMANVFSVSLHEFGHLVGLPHLDVPGSLMRPVYWGAKCLSRVDLDAVCAVHGCDASRTNPC